MADQMSPFFMGAYGHPVVKTPNLDILAQQGVRFDAAYSNSPVCAPARASLITGKFCSNINCFDNSSSLADGEPTLMHYLSSEGYECIASGKLHIIGADQLHGFRKRLTTDIYPADFEWLVERTDPTQTMFSGHTHASSYTTPKIGVKSWSTGLAYDEETHFRALEYIRARGNWNNPWQPKEKEPFFLSVSYHHPHDPFQVTQELWDLYQNDPIDLPEFTTASQPYSQMDKWLNTFWGIDQAPQLLSPENLTAMRRSYFALVSYVDQKVGELIQALNQADLFDNTVIIFTSDHGEMLGEKGLVENPSEDTNLVGDPRYADLIESYRQAILERFDPEKIEAAVNSSIARRKIIRSSMRNNQISWDYSPVSDGSRQYIRRMSYPKIRE